MNYTARISQRNIKQVGNVSTQARFALQMQLSAMQCKRLGHIPGKTITAGAYHNTYRLCKRCMKMIPDKDNKRDEQPDK